MSNDTEIAEIDQLIQGTLASISRLARNGADEENALFPNGTDFLHLRVHRKDVVVELELGNRTAVRNARLASRDIDVFLDDDLALGDHIPSAGEVATCGAISGKIVRGTPRFDTLVKNTNSLIVFKDEEGTGADRMMSTRLSEKMNTLAGLVKTEWPGTKLRVVEAWDENDEHADNSLHYEGRAADITTSPVDSSRLGRLARLAVTAGFDWVWYEDSSHVHVAVTA